MRAVGAVLAVSLAAATGCSDGSGSQQAVACDDAVEIAEDKAAEFNRLMESAGVLDGSNSSRELSFPMIDGSTLTTTTDGSAEAAQLRRSIEQQAIEPLKFWATVVTQNADCFGAEARAQAQRVLDEL